PEPGADRAAHAARLSGRSGRARPCGRSGACSRRGRGTGSGAGPGTGAAPARRPAHPASRRPPRNAADEGRLHRPRPERRRNGRRPRRRHRAGAGRPAGLGPARRRGPRPVAGVGSGRGAGRLPRPGRPSAARSRDRARRRSDGDRAVRRRARRRRRAGTAGGRPSVRASAGCRLAAGGTARPVPGVRLAVRHRARPGGTRGPAGPRRDRAPGRAAGHPAERTADQPGPDPRGDRAGGPAVEHHVPARVGRPDPRRRGRAEARGERDRCHGGRTGVDPERPALEPAVPGHRQGARPRADPRAGRGRPGRRTGRGAWPAGERGPMGSRARRAPAPGARRARIPARPGDHPTPDPDELRRAVMTDQTVAPGQMRLYDEVRPALPDGLYRLTASTTLSRPDFAVSSVDGYFLVDGPRFALPASDVAGVYPPADAQGAFADVLPQIVLGRRTLPWERDLDPGHVIAPVPDPLPLSPTGVPWLGLLLFVDDPARREVTVLPDPVPLSSVVPDSIRGQMGLDGTDPAVRAIEVDAPLLRQVAPSKDEVRLLSHVRQVNLDDRELAAGDSDGWFAVVQANRLPVPGLRHRACLVSLEQRSDVIFPAGPQNRQQLPVSAPQRLVLLYSWTFTAA